MSRLSFWGLLAAMIACGAAVTVGQLDSEISLESTRAMWADVLHDVDALGLQVTRVSAAKEMHTGDELAARVSAWGAEQPEKEKYVEAVTASLLPYVHRKDIRYRVHVIQSPQINAFALPGGHIYVLTGLLDFLQSEAELAAILGHEISHVDLRHSIERYQYQLALRKIGAPGAGEIVEIAHSLVTMGYTQNQELEADASGERLAIEAGYDPDAAVAVFRRMQAKFGETGRSPSTTPIGEAGGAVADVIGSYFRTHPPSAERARQLSDMLARNHRELAGRMFYKGIRNYETGVPRSSMDLPPEKRIY